MSTAIATDNSFYFYVNLTGSTKRPAIDGYNYRLYMTTRSSTEITDASFTELEMPETFFSEIEYSIESRDDKKFGMPKVASLKVTFNTKFMIDDRVENPTTGVQWDTLRDLLYDSTLR